MANKKVVLSKSAATKLAKEMRESVWSYGVTHGSGYFTLTNFVIDDIPVDSFVELTMFKDDAGRDCYCLYSCAEVEGGDNICESEWMDMKTTNESELAEYLYHLANTVFNEQEMKEMLRNCL